MPMIVKVTSHLGEFLTAADRQIEAALEAIGGQAEGHCKVEIENSPRRVDTGLLRNSITYALDGKTPKISSYKGDNPPRDRPKAGIPSGSYSGTAPKEAKTSRCVYVGTNVEYAIYVHDGTMRMKPNRFIKNGVTKNAQEYKNIVKLYLEGGE